MLILVPALVESNEGESRNIYLFYRAGPQSRDIHGYSVIWNACSRASRAFEEKSSRLFSLNAYSHDHLYQNRFRHLRLPSGGFWCTIETAWRRAYSAHKTTLLILCRRNFLVSLHTDCDTMVSFLNNAATSNLRLCDGTVSLVDSGERYPCEFSHWTSN